ncbi:MAG: 1-(5-phosphoribosyl)-5-[(5-phosphoribosylamino)methylideneamino] imidazole-4-carboxamide isomerase [Xanthomonadales bacterium]|nr:1-(5-phosphoribosyl)-5-[(5-phosphoribosylamino)methylideneamino] imidazole-4-carboxamide isomerase [Xanthomonadales bacterium]
MKLIPAIDLLDGRCVRLLHGDFNRVTEYDASAARLAGRYAEAGAEWLHVVDLAASRDGADADTWHLFQLIRAAPQKVQTGGGVRGRQDIQDRLDAGAARVVVGSLCATRPDRFARWLGDFGADALVAALDVRIDAEGTPWPRTHGWTEEARRNLWSLLDELAGAGLRHLLCTDIGRDGALSGPNLDLYAEILGRFPAIELQASGGVASLDDLRSLKEVGAAGAIIGKALLDGRFAVNDALQAVR